VLSEKSEWSLLWKVSLVLTLPLVSVVVPEAVAVALSSPEELAVAVADWEKVELVIVGAAESLPVTDGWYRMPGPIVTYSSAPGGLSTTTPNGAP
jgi:hypothetical protein